MQVKPGSPQWTLFVCVYILLFSVLLTLKILSALCMNQCALSHCAVETASERLSPTEAVWVPSQARHPIYLWVFLLFISTNIVYRQLGSPTHLESGLSDSSPAGTGNTMNLSRCVSACKRLLIYIPTWKDGPCPFWPSVFHAYCIVI